MSYKLKKMQRRCLMRMPLVSLVFFMRVKNVIDQTRAYLGVF